MQQPMSDNIKGATVILTATDANGQTYTIGETTTDTAGNFGKSWTPPSEGDYMIKAELPTTESYGSSYDTTYLTVGPAASASSPIEPEQPTPTEPTPEEPTPEEPTTPEQPTPEEPTPEEPEPTVAEQPLISAELAIVIAIVAACIIGAVAYIALRRRK